ncbi:MAG: thermonuclease family protein [Maioricimonas sp. JB049]
MPGRIRQPVSPAVLALLVISVLLGRQLIWPAPAAPKLTHALPERITITAAGTDGTLIARQGGSQRQLGVRLPEATTTADEPARTPAMAAAHEFLVERCAGRSVRLEWDRHRQTSDGAALAFAFVDDVCLNEQLIEAGLARFDPAFPLRSDMQRRFQTAEERARTASRGLWASPQE